ncbi:PREDICTED: hairy and enhancer of split-related protein HELT [Myotis brandtii]|uniref:hairy and enhancer of split-related protein HELT n=1 Tax=Myotis brandtii TaxID=109478 RepID=UPI000703DC0D|nr:PREDICTED: hairy and enhancer of split-related protein HELT [Myotis brandtii]
MAHISKNALVGALVVELKFELSGSSDHRCLLLCSHFGGNQVKIGDTLTTPRRRVNEEMARRISARTTRGSSLQAALALSSGCSPASREAGRERANTRTRVSHKVIEKRRRDRINRCLNELGKTVPMALAKQTSGKLEKAEILEMTVQYLRALHSADFPRGREKAELLAEFANYFHYGYHECMKNLVHYLTTVERMETKDTKYARILAFLQSKARLGAEPAFPPLGSLSEPDFSYQLHPAGPDPSPTQQHSPFLAPVQGLDRHYLNLIGHAHPNGLNLHPPQHPQVL